MRIQTTVQRQVETCLEFLRRPQINIGTPIDTLTPFVSTVDISVKVLETITKIRDDHIYGSSSKLEGAV